MITRLSLLFSYCLLLVGCATQINMSSITGTYEGQHLMLYKEIALRPDSTYLYTIEGDMYAIPIIQEGNWFVKGKRVKLDASASYKSIRATQSDTLQTYTILLYLHKATGDLVADFSGYVSIEGERHRIERIQGNQYKVSLNQAPCDIVLTDINKVYKDLYLDLGSYNGNILYVYLFRKDELQNNKWTFQYRDNKLLYKGLEYRKIDK